MNFYVINIFWHPGTNLKSFFWWQAVENPKNPGKTDMLIIASEMGVGMRNWGLCMEKSKVCRFEQEKNFNNA